MDFFQAVILSSIEGLTEYLPISSTGHMVLASDILNVVQTDFVKSFEIIIQLGAILAVVVLYWKTLLTNTKLWPKIITAFLPAAILGLIFYKIIKDILIGNTIITLLALLVGGVVLIIIEQFFKTKQHKVDRLEDLSIKNSFIIGLAQSVSMIPGVSRSAASIVGGMLTGLSREKAVEFSFFLAVPTMAAATGLDLAKTKFYFSSSQIMILGIGLVGSFIVAISAVKFFTNFVKKHTFIPFGIYRIILAIVFALFYLR